MQGRTWKKIDDNDAEKIKSYLLENGGIEQNVKGQYEKWRVIFSDSIFTFFNTGTLYSTISPSNDPAIQEVWELIDSFDGSSLLSPRKNFLIGLDETGKGEVIGHTVLTGVIFPKDIYDKLIPLVSSADTKKRRTFDYWDKIFREIDQFRNSGLDFIIENIPPWTVDKYNINKILDVSYQRILSIFFRKANLTQCRIVLDDYGIGHTLKRFLNFLSKQGSEVIITSHSEDKYLEAKIASLISKRMREFTVKNINQDPKYKIDSLSIGSGNLGNKQTIEWLIKWHRSGAKWPWFIKKSFQPIRNLEGKPGKVIKKIPPIKEKLLSANFLEEFNSGKLSIKSLSIVCSNCGNILNSANFAIYKKNDYNISELKCINCSAFIYDAGFTLRFYCGYAIPDSSAIQRSIISNDLAGSKFFENFTLILTSVVRKECDPTPRGRKEFDQLRKYNQMGRIKIESVGNIGDIPNGIPNVVRDEMIINSCLEYNAILITADKTMATFAISKKIFTILA